ncbi:MAG TPA: GNAT family N-acetyltransferase, partial [Nitriliruptoraceae bacterium]|nr:GNAT family N-acetyltransferase [Nitriliruptoraceae bacterium]
RTFFSALADEFVDDDVMRLHVLSVGDRPAAATVSLVDGDRWGLYNSAFDPVLSSFAPGMVLVTELIREAADQDLATFDLLRGDEPYKYRFGATDRVIQRVDVTR